MAGSKYCGILISKKTILFNKKGRTELHCAKLKESVTLLILLCLGHWVERIEKDRQLQWTKTGSEKDLELAQVVVVPFVIGALAATSKRLKDWLKSSVELLRKPALLGTAKL